MRRGVAATGLALAVTLLASDANAGNTTVSGAACHAYQGWDEPVLLHSFLGCVNMASTNTLVVFGETRINQPAAQTLFVDIAGSTSATVYCNAYLYPFNNGPGVWSMQQIGTCNQFTEFAYSVPADAWGYLTVFCNLPPNCRILGTGLSPG